MEVCLQLNLASNPILSDVQRLDGLISEIDRNRAGFIGRANSHQSGYNYPDVDRVLGNAYPLSARTFHE